jgi:tetratricopeptide (TPR) repeat protein
LFVAVSAIAGAPTPANAQSNALSKAELKLNWAACIDTTDEPDLCIAACLRIIRRGYEEVENLSIAYENLAHQLLRKNDIDGAISAYSEAIRVNPKNAQAWTNRGARFRSKKEYKRAIDDHTRAIELDRNHKDAWFNRGYVYQEIGDRDKAIADYRQALRVNPNDEDARAQLKQLGASQ